MKYKYFFVLIFCLQSIASFGQGAGDFISYQKLQQTLLIRGSRGNLKITTFTRDIFRIETIPSGKTALNSSYTVVLLPSYVPDNIIETKTAILINLEKCTLEINKFPLSVALKDGNEIKIKEVKGFQQVRDSVNIGFEINPKDVYHGAGSRPFGPDLNRKAFDFYNTWEFAYYDQATGLAQSFNVPFLVSSHKYGILFDSNMPGAMRVYVGATDSTRMTVESQSAGKWVYYLINGDTNDEILENYTLLTGRQPLPPRWALGYIQSKFGYKNESEATVAVTKLQSEGFPLDALALDLYWYGDETTMGNFDWDAQKWPNSTDMIGKLKAKGVKTILITDPYITTKSFNFRVAESLSLFAKKPGTNSTYTQDIWNGTVGLLDIFKPATQNWLWQQYKRLAAQGVAGWWTDKIEPDYDPMDALYALGTASQIHNFYPLFWSKNIFDQHQRDFPNDRLFNLTRSGWAGSQRYGVLPWSGDVARYWAGLRLQIPIIIQAGMSGIGYMHSDVGGFATMSDKTEKDEELDLRWFQFGTFTPVLRSHGQRSNVEPFNLSEPFYSTVKKYLNIRYQLLPYIYSLSWKNSVSGRPICMPMDYFTNSRALGNINDQYFFGENLLIAPVLLHGMPSRKVVLPPGKWFDFWNNAPFNGNANIFPNLTVNDIPVYAKAGSFIPMSASTSIKSTDYYTSDSLSVKFFQDISVPVSAFTMYHDDGKDRNSLANGKHELIDFNGYVSEDTIQITVQRRKNYAQSLTIRNMLLEVENLTSPPLSVTLNGKPFPVVYLSADFKNGSAFYDHLAKQLKIRYDWDCKAQSTITILRDGLSVVTGIESRFDENTLMVYPNPSQPQTPLTVKATIPYSGDYTLEIFNSSGRNVLQQPLGMQSQGALLNSKVDVTNLHGLYILKLKNAEGKFSAKSIIIE
ncbi:TIM-barrel domain-containing protein [Dyadobacter arcticus]|uniref:Oligosaccharide 4-alpha-D-glucosyltransferase n=1 Tax=Dyadobacter arcticus TaxID=1078754 RepID=A0ABX0UTI4_9BACT|nr:TIM-barrel domain-containing protein [Dyadobacter arcticus]NIJ55723.1 oligosaccharide 4-alpha-D-glucosyltransferase [Dyadobacter arcticus]